VASGAYPRINLCPRKGSDHSTSANCAAEVLSPKGTAEPNVARHLPSLQSYGLQTQLATAPCCEWSLPNPALTCKQTTKAFATALHAIPSVKNPTIHFPPHLHLLNCRYSPSGASYQQCRLRNYCSDPRHFRIPVGILVLLHLSVAWTPQLPVRGFLGLLPGECRSLRGICRLCVG
jgi:hypothetical protein